MLRASLAGKLSATENTKGKQVLKNCIRQREGPALRHEKPASSGLWFLFRTLSTELGVVAWRFRVDFLDRDLELKVQFLGLRCVAKPRTSLPHPSCWPLTQANSYTTLFALPDEHLECAASGIHLRSEDRSSC